MLYTACSVFREIVGIQCGRVGNWPGQTGRLEHIERLDAAAYDVFINARPTL